MRLLLSLLLAFASGSAGAGSWPVFQRDPARTGYSADGVYPPLTLQWTYTTGDGIVSSPVVAYDKVYFGSRDKNVYALNAYTGALVWQFSTGKRVEASAAVAGERVFIPSRDGKLYALDASSGTLLWSFDTGSAQLSSPVAYDGKVYLATGYPEKKLYALDASNGTPLASTDISNFTASSLVLDASGSKLFLGTSDGLIQAWDLGLSQSWGAGVRTAGSSFFATPAFYSGKLLAAPGGDDRNLHALQPADGSETWPAPAPTLTTASDEVAVVGSVAVSTSSAFVGSGRAPHKLYSLDLSTGGIRWSVSLGNANDSTMAPSPAVALDMVYALSPQGELYGVHAGSGGVREKLNLGAQGLSSPAVANGWVYVGTLDGKLRGFESRRTWGLASPDPLLDPGGRVVEGTVTVKGTVQSPDLTDFAVEYGEGSAPASWVQLTSGTASAARQDFAVWDTNELSKDTYSLRVRVNESAASDRVTEAVYTFNVAQSRTAAVSAAAGGTASLPDGTEVVIPAGAIAAGDSLTIAKLFPGDADYTDSGIPAGVSATTVVRKFTMASSPSFFRFLKPVTLKLPYQNASYTKESDLRIYFYDTSRGQWRIVNTSVVRSDEKRVSAEVDHFTVFRVMQYSPRAILLEDAEVYSYPNPARGNTLRFKFLVGETSDVAIRVFDVAGDIVARLEKPAAPGGIASTLSWDISGIASGVYIYRLTAKTASGKEASVIKKLAVIH